MFPMGPFTVPITKNSWLMDVSSPIFGRDPSQWLDPVDSVTPNGIAMTPRLRLYGAYDFLQPLQCAILVHGHEGANPGRVAPCKARDENFVADVGMGWIRMELIFVRCVCTCLHCSYLFRSLFLTLST